MEAEVMEFILRHSPNGVIVAGPGLHLIWFNNAAEEILGKPLQDRIGCHLSELFVNKDEIEKFKKLTGHMHHHFKVGDKTLLFDCYPLSLESDKPGTAIIFQDISHYESIAKELSSYKALMEQLDAVIESSYDGIYITDGKANTLRANKAYERITGIKAEEVVGRNMQDLVEAGFFSQSVTLEVLKTKKVCSLRQKLKTGKEILVTGSPVFNEKGEISLVVTNNRDVTELAKLWQELAEKDYANQRYRREVEELRQQLIKDSTIVVRDPLMLRVMETAKKVAPTNSTVLLLGETGVGKEVLAKFIHRNSQRYARGSFVQVNCAAIPETLLESELFGYVKGAFTGASREGKVGLIELADGGTLFLDEIGELPFPMQAKLLRVLQEQEFIPLGGKAPKQVDLRVIVATNRDLKVMVANKQFREDLFYRINVIPIEIPPLRERPEDIVMLAVHFLKEFNAKYNLNRYFSPGCLQYLCRAQWPGNVRQLRNQVERAVLLSESNQLEPQLFNNEFINNYTGSNNGHQPVQPLKNAVSQLEKDLIKKALKKYGSNKQAADALGINVTTLWRKIKRYRI